MFKVCERKTIESFCFFFSDQTLVCVISRVLTLSFGDNLRDTHTQKDRQKERLRAQTESECYRKCL